MNQAEGSAAFPVSWPALLNPPIAHRGLWSPRGAPENSLAAFEAACVAGYGVELDVRLSSDGEAMVFHDAHLARMTGAAARLGEKSAAALSALRLKDTAEPIPPLSQVLDRVAGRALVLVEIKSRPGEEGPLDERVAAVIDRYAGPLAVIGFNPFSHAWWAANRPEVLRGLNSYGYDDEAAGALSEAQRRAFRDLQHVETARPHFLALSTDRAASDPARALRSQGYPVIGWTLRSEAEWASAEADCDNLIFEGFHP